MKKVFSNRCLKWTKWKEEEIKKKSSARKKIERERHIWMHLCIYRWLCTLHNSHIYLFKVVSTTQHCIVVDPIDPLRFFLCVHTCGHCGRKTVVVKKKTDSLMPLPMRIRKYNSLSHHIRSNNNNKTMSSSTTVEDQKIYVSPRLVDENRNQSKHSSSVYLGSLFHSYICPFIKNELHSFNRFWFNSYAEIYMCVIIIIIIYCIGIGIYYNVLYMCYTHMYDVDEATPLRTSHEVGSYDDNLLHIAWDLFVFFFCLKPKSKIVD